LNKFCKSRSNIGFECFVIAIFFCIKDPVKISEITYIPWLNTMPYLPTNFHVDVS